MRIEEVEILWLVIKGRKGQELGGIWVGGGFVGLGLQGFFPFFLKMRENMVCLHVWRRWWEFPEKVGEMGTKVMLE